MGKKLLLGFLTAIGIILYADGGFVWDTDIEPDLDDADQKAIILYNKGIETMIISINYRGIAANFAWLLPTPSPPEVSLAPSDIFREMEKIASEIKKGEEPSPSKGMFLGSEGVKIKERKLIGLYDIAVLSANDPEQLFNWCTSQGFAISPNAIPIIRNYIDRGWCFTAVKVNGYGLGRMGILEGELAPIMLRFPSQRIIYPLKISYINRFSLSPRVAIYDEICGHPVLFGKEKKELIRKVKEKVIEDIAKGRQFENSILYRLGFFELQNSYQIALMQKNPQSILTLVELYVKDDADKLSERERNLVVIYVVAPFKVTIAKETNAQLASFLEIPFSLKVRAETIGRYFMQDDGANLLPKRAIITKVYGYPFFASFQDDLLLARSWENLKFIAFLLIVFGSSIFIWVGAHIQGNRLHMIVEDLKTEGKKLRTLWIEREDLLTRLMNLVFDHLKDKNLLEEIARLKRLFIQEETLKGKLSLEKELNEALGRLFTEAEKIPSLKFDLEFIHLKEQLLRVEREISLQTLRYCKLAREYEKLKKSIPIVFFPHREDGFSFREGLFG